MPETLLRFVVLVLPVALVPFLMAGPPHEPSTSKLGNLLRAVTAGLLSIVLALALLELRRRAFPSGFATTSRATHAVVVALSEELSKLAAYLLVLRPRGGRVRQSLRSAAAVALVFAVIENALYFTVPVSLLWTRALVVPLVHAGCTVILVAAVLRLRSVGTKLPSSVLMLGAVGLHALHNLLFSMSTAPIAVRLIPSLVAVAIAARLYYRSPSHSI